MSDWYFQINKFSSFTKKFQKYQESQRITKHFIGHSIIIGYEFVSVIWLCDYYYTVVCVIATFIWDVRNNKWKSVNVNVTTLVYF